MSTSRTSKTFTSLRHGRANVAKQHVPCRCERCLSCESTSTKRRSPNQWSNLTEGHQNVHTVNPKRNACVMSLLIINVLRPQSQLQFTCCPMSPWPADWSRATGWRAPSSSCTSQAKHRNNARKPNPRHMRNAQHSLFRIWRGAHAGV